MLVAELEKSHPHGVAREPSIRDSEMSQPLVFLGFVFGEPDAHAMPERVRCPGAEEIFRRLFALWLNKSDHAASRLRSIVAEAKIKVLVSQCRCGIRRNSP
jgi:hypothetical protein